MVGGDDGGGKQKVRSRVINCRTVCITHPAVRTYQSLSFISRILGLLNARSTLFKSPGALNSRGPARASSPFATACMLFTMAARVHTRFSRVCRRVSFSYIAGSRAKSWGGSGGEGD